MDYEVSANNIQLKSSFEVSKDDFERELAAIRDRHPDSLVWNRSMDSLKREWAVHNAVQRWVGKCVWTFFRKSEWTFGSIE